MSRTLLILVLISSLASSLGAAELERPAWVTPPVKAERVRQGFFDSQAAGARVSYHIYIPEACEAQDERRFPVLYWLHGTGGGLAGIAPVTAYFAQAMRTGKLAPMYIVFANGLGASMWCDSKDGLAPIETIFITELIPHIDATFRTLAKREGRILEGFSMGGYGAARIGLKHPHLFAVVSVLAGGPLDLAFAGPRTRANPAERAAILQRTFGGDLNYFRAQSPLTLAQQQAQAVRESKLRLRIAVGARDFTAALNQDFARVLGQLGIAHSLQVVPDVPHDTLALLTGMGEGTWAFYRGPFGQ